MDRDVNAAANIAKRFIESGNYTKFIRRRKKAKKSTKKKVIRVKHTTRTKRKHPKPDRTKNAATPKRTKGKRKPQNAATTRRFDGLEVKGKKLSSSEETVSEGSISKASEKSMTLTSSSSDKSYRRRYRLVNLC